MEIDAVERRTSLKIAHSLWRASVMILLFLLSVAVLVGGYTIHRNWVHLESQSIRIRKNTEAINTNSAVEEYNRRLDHIIQLMEAQNAGTGLQGRGVRSQGAGDHQDSAEVQLGDER
jgi:hypothetical protein